ncbi:hypothetical protein LPJ56_004992, partial [Coemansia sp. RSA 2599]
MSNFGQQPVFGIPTSSRGRGRGQGQGRGRGGGGGWSGRRQALPLGGDPLDEDEAASGYFSKDVDEGQTSMVNNLEARYED